jgi:hypothetical protein
MKARWERRELAESRRRGQWDTWAVQSDYSIDDDWLHVHGENNRIYAPLEHHELVSQFAALSKYSAARLLGFVRAYGRLGYLELADVDGREATAEWKAHFKDAPEDQRHERIYDEPIAWIRAHAETVAWVLRAADALDPRQINSDVHLETFRDLWESYPQRYGIRSNVVDRPNRLAVFRPNGLAVFLIHDAAPTRKKVGRLLSDTLTVNLRGISRRVEWREVESLLSLATKDYGVDAEQLGRAVLQLGRRFAGGDKSAAVAIHMMGMSVSELRGKDLETLVRMIADGIARIPNPLQKSVAASDLFGAQLGGALIAVSKHLGATQGLRNFWGGSSLLESVYTLLTDAVTGGQLATCKASDCGQVFIRTHANAEHCPPRVDQDKSSCTTRKLQRAYRQRLRVKKVSAMVSGQPQLKAAKRHK